MAKTTRPKFEPSLEPLIEYMGLPWLIEKVGVERLLTGMNPKQVKRLLTAMDSKLVASNLKEVFKDLPEKTRQELRELLDKE